MGWAFCGMDWRGREIGYGIGATCDRRGCNAEIDRGLGYCCGTMHNGDYGGCGRYYCGKHLGWVGYRGGCPHRGRKAWGKTKCQLLRIDRPQLGYPPVYYCACHEFSHDEPLNIVWDPRFTPDDPILVDYHLVPGYDGHLSSRNFASYA